MYCSPRDSGSSPHTRGAPKRAFKNARIVRIIPAYAGSTPASPPLAARVADHPRIRGEHSAIWRPGASEPGSSPHTRGALVVFSLDPHFRRIIPAYAGSTRAVHLPTRVPADHPRIRGEHARMRGFRVLARGSSPHTRGARPGRRALLLRRGIIPAYAGSTRPTSPASAVQPDHPRIRGEHMRVLTSRKDIDGSSPHTRGAPVADVDPESLTRIIPAYAGSTDSLWTPRARTRDHPRIRGEHASRT